MKFTYENPELIHHGKRVDLLSIDSDHPKGGKVRREVVSHPGAVVILPLLDPETVLLIKNERPVVQEVLWELPAGTLEEGEDPLACAFRELEEETGYKAKHVTHLFDIYTTPGFCNELLHIYLAEELSYVGQDLDETEKIEVVPTSLLEAKAMIKSNTIRDAKTTATLLYFLS